MDRARNVSGNYIMQLVYQIIVNMAVPVVTIFWLTRKLGADSMGTFNYLASWSSYFVLFATLGTSQYGQREIAFRQNDRKAYSKVFFSVQSIRMILSSAFVVLWLLFSYFFNADKTILLILTLNLINVMLDISWFYIGLEEFSLVIKRSIAVRLVYTASIFLFIKGPEDLIAYVLIEVGFFALVSLSLWPGVLRRIDKTGSDGLLRHIKGAFLLFLPALSLQLYSLIDKTMIGLFSVGGYSENAYYELTQNMIKAGLFFSYTLSTVMLPRISSTISEGNELGMVKHIERSYNFTFLTILPIAVILFSISSRIVPIFFGSGFDSIIVLARMLCPVLVAIALSIVTGQLYFVPANHVGKYTLTLVFGSVLNIVLNAILIPRYLSKGAVFASVISEWAITIFQFILVSRLAQMRIRSILSMFFSYGIASLIMALFYYVSSRFFSNSIFAVIAMVLAGLLVYFTALFLMKDRYVRFLFHKVRSRL